ncbi:MAG: hypothetical protein HYW48_04205 [Deltaproteobacteria bacterium]|nr:hypothetical protein [Deltaproteobacteria bacterium]
MEEPAAQFSPNHLLAASDKALPHPATLVINRRLKYLSLKRTPHVSSFFTDSLRVSG